jgi:hypothetical protein
MFAVIQSRLSMSEKQSYSPASRGEPTAWQLDAIAERLHTEAQPDNDVSFGDGYRYRFGQICELAVYPDTGTVIFRSGKKRLELGGQNPPVIDEDGVVFTDTDGSSTRFAITPEHQIVVATAVFVGTREPAESPPTAALESSDVFSDTRRARTTALRRFCGV